MEVYAEIMKIIDRNLIFCLFPMILTLILTELFYKNRFKTKKVLNIVRWIIILYAILTIIHFFIGLAVKPDDSVFISRATGPYGFAYWLMFMSSTILPLTLLNDKLASKTLYLLLISIFIKAGWYFERFVIIVTGLHRDYAHDVGSSDFLIPTGILLFFLQGAVLAISGLFIVEIIERNRKAHNTG